MIPGGVWSTGLHLKPQDGFQPMSVFYRLAQNSLICLAVEYVLICITEMQHFPQISGAEGRTVGDASPLNELGSKAQKAS